MTQNQIDYWKQKRKEIKIQNEENGFSEKDKIKKGFRSYSESNTCPICSKYSPTNHEFGFEEGDNSIWFHSCESCGIDFKEVWSSNGSSYLYHEIIN